MSVENTKNNPIKQQIMDSSVLLHPEVEAGSLFDRATRWETLHQAWEKVRANNGAAGGDGVTIERFAKGAEGRLSRLSHEVRNGRYRPAPARRVHIPKVDGGVRPLDIPAVIDRVLHAAVAATLTPVLDAEFEDSSFAYRPGRSVAQAVARVAALRRAGYTHVVDGDIVRYFERIPHDRLLLRLEQHVDDPMLIDLIGVFLEHHSHMGLGVPQGSPLSPLLANLYLDSVDEAIEGHGVRLVRFADDFLLLCKGEVAARDAREDMADLLAGEGLEMHAGKTRLVSFDQGVRFLGHVFVRGMIWKEVLADDTPPEDAIAAAEQLNAAAPDAPAQEAEDEAPVPRGRYAPRQRVVYMVEPGRKLTAEAESFVVQEPDGAEIARMAHRRVDRIEVSTACDVDGAALDLAGATDTTIVRVDGFGRCMGQWSPLADGRAARQLAQAGHVLDAAKRVALARILVEGRIQSQRTHLKRMTRGKPDADVATAAPKLKRMARWALLHPKLDTIPALMGKEGEAAAVYWPLIARQVGDAALFRGNRRRRIGADPFNVALDVLCSFLARDLSVVVRRVGLHPGFGVLHTADDGAEALVYDLMEEFRAPVAEACALALFGRRALTKASFSQWGETWRLTREGFAATVRGYETWLAHPVQGQRSGVDMLWRGVFEEQAHAFAAHCEGGADYQPYRMDF